MNSNWWSCDGSGFAMANGQASDHCDGCEPAHPHPHTPTHPITRRGLLLGGALAAVGWAARETTALADLSLNPRKREPEGDILVTIFLRGGADGLNVVVPYQEDAYHKARVTTRIAAPKESKAAASDRAIDLDGFFGLHPALGP